MKKILRHIAAISLVGCLYHSNLYSTESTSTHSQNDSTNQANAVSVTLQARQQTLAQSSKIVPIHYDNPPADSAPREFQAIAFFYTQGVASNVFSENPFTGEVIGRLFGENQSTTGGPTAIYFEQRLLPFLIWQPNLLNGKAVLRASFEIDWTWGDESYLFGGNRGGAFNADRVNIQTQNIEVELIPAEGWAINIGLQRLFDTPYNPYRTAVNTLLNTGYRLAYWGSDAPGISVRKDWETDRIKAGFYQLYELAPEADNDVILWEAMYEHDIDEEWKIGASAWYLHDKANGQAGVATIGEGFTAPLTGWNGTYKMPIRYTIADAFGATPQNRYHANVLWTGAFWSYNPEFANGRWGMSGFFNANFGNIDINDATIITENSAPVDTIRQWKRFADIAGFGANIRAGYRYGQTQQDVALLDVLYTSGDNNGQEDKKYSGVITGNTWGFPGSIFVGHSAYLLLPHGNVVNRFIGAVGDISNLGLGLLAVMSSVEKGIIPNKLAVRAGLAAAWSNAPTKIADTTAGVITRSDAGTFMGVETSLRVVYTPAILMNVELHLAHAWLGDFYDGRESLNGEQLFNRGTRNYLSSAVAERPRNPWTAQLVFRYLMF